MEQPKQLNNYLARRSFANSVASSVLVYSAGFAKRSVGALVRWGWVSSGSALDRSLREGRHQTAYEPPTLGSSNYLKKGPRQGTPYGHHKESSETLP